MNKIYPKYHKINHLIVIKEKNFLFLIYNYSQIIETCFLRFSTFSIYPLLLLFIL
jgi:hypothetical protein